MSDKVETEIVDMHGKSCEAEMRTITAEDGVEEDHVTIHPQTGKLFFVGLSGEEYDRIFRNKSK